MRKDFVRADLVADNVKALENAAGEPLAATPLYPLVLLLADIADEIATGEDVYITLSAPRAHNCLMLTVGLNGQKTYVSGACLEELAKGAKSLL